MPKILIKTPEQIAWIRKAGKLTSMTLDMIEKYILPWVSTLELDQIIHTFVIQNGGVSATVDYLGNNKWGKSPNAYKHASCISLNDVICHGIPRKETILKEGDILNIDITTIVDVSLL